MKLTIRDVPEKHWARATSVAKQFNAEFPDRMGFHAGVVYVWDAKAVPPEPSFYVYRTKTGVIVRGTTKETPNEQT